MTKTETIIIRVTPKMKEDILELAKKERREVSDYLRLLLEEIIDGAKEDDKKINHMAKFRKRPVIIDAIQYNGNNGSELERWSNGAVLQSPVLEPTDYNPTGAYVQIKTIDTSNSWATAVVGDWVCKGIEGEFYPCKSDIFEKTYEPVIDV